MHLRSLLNVMEPYAISQLAPKGWRRRAEANNAILGLASVYFLPAVFPKIFANPFGFWSCH